ncbi:DUF2207 domain-containing protein [Rhodoplanes roseus]|uniref:DUF2207 domain-containing protein n=1 Tax=Rhodoplanes roseus TaxID=29409 RepID=A0A327L6U3_9BRAD|nr:DUF2207 domain-containing protein [Rhodoplanes roseus]RAI46067.1 hypothetical protein CH341_00430 [Rhodoplanes roseus]
MSARAALRRATLAIAVLVVAIATGLAPATAQERILSFLSDVSVERNGDLMVTETIRVQAEGRDIRRGILRDVPTVYTRRDGTRVEVGFDVLGVQRDGQAETFAREALANGVRLRIGSPETFLRSGPHTYVITYRTTRQIGFFDDVDELYWNATGTGWTFAIDVAEARITLPEAVPFRRSAFYTGPQGATGHDATVVEQRPGLIVFRTTRPLPPKSGLTVAAAWQKGIVAPPTDAQKLGWWLTDNLAVFIALAGGAGLLGYYMVAWVRVGRDPARGTIIPLFGPPEGFTAAAVRYVSRMGFDDRTFAAAIVDLGVRGHLTVADVGSLTRVSPRQGGSVLPAPERAVPQKLFVRGPVTLEQENHERIAAAKTALQRGLDAAYRGVLFRTNAGWAAAGVVGWIALAAAVVVTTFMTRGETVGGPLIVGTLFGSIGAFAGALLLYGLLRGQVKVAAFVVGAIFLVVFGGAGLLALTASADTLIGAVPGLVPVALAPVVALAFPLLKAPTPQGRKVMDQIEGFRRYLGTAEEERLEFLTPPQKTPELFERFLPYAIALDVENTWAQRFAGVLAAAGVGAAAAAWYTSDRGRDDPVGWTEKLGSGLTDTVSSSSTAPGSSGGSGSDGGGSSGGGGGGGGGSGW